MINSISFRKRSGAMISSCLATILLSSMFAVLTNAQTPPPVTLGKINPNPNCGKSEICFETPQDGLARDESRSQFFYAVILKTTKACGVTEDDRQSVQKLFPHNKVFATQFECGGEQNAFLYENLDRDHGFIAVYAGRTKSEGLKFLKKVKQLKEFGDAKLRRTQAILVS